MRARVRGILAAVCFLTATVLAACGGQSRMQPVLNSAEVVATWTSPDGGSIVFAADHRFMATGLRLDKFWTGCANLGKITVSGRWQFLNSEGDLGPGPAGYSKGRMVSLEFDGGAGSSYLGCSGGGIELTSWNVNSIPGLCLEMDLDTPCDGYIFNKN